MGGARCGGGCRCGGSVGYIFLLGNTFFVLAVCWRKIFSNFLKFSLFFHFFSFFSFFFTFLSGVPDAAGLSDTFLVLEILVEKKKSQIFSNFLGIHFYVLAIAENFLKFSQIFTFFHFFSFFLQNFAKNFRGARCGRSVGYIFSIGNFGGKNYLKFSQIFSEYIFMYWQWGVQVGSGCRIQSLYWWHIGKNYSTRSQIFWNLCTFLFSLDFHFFKVSSLNFFSLRFET